MHTPVFLNEVIQALKINKGDKYIDATYGEGGHASEIVKLGGQVLGIDWDHNQVRNQKLKFKSDKITIVIGNYADIETIAKQYEFIPCDGILFDLGLSMRQIRYSKRGFSYKEIEEPLDMRVSTNLAINAQKIVNSYTSEKLHEIFTRYSEELDSIAIVKSIIRARGIKPIFTVGEFLASINVSSEKTKARLFQALRIEVNDEWNNIKKGLDGSYKVLRKQGRLIVLTFHQGEDRVVKQWMRSKKYTSKYTKPIKIISDKKFERSAKLRLFTK